MINDTFLRLIWDDISKLQHPPELTDLPPKKLGLAREGKLKAAQWPNVCTTLALTLTREWLRPPLNSTHREALVHFFHLIGLIRILYLASLNQDDITSFKRHALAYVKGIQRGGLKPNHHYLLHLGDLMEQFGPMRSWWSFPFERLNGEIQKTKTNNISGKCS
jgi:hypothetical protein